MRSLVKFAKVYPHIVLLFVMILLVSCAQLTKEDSEIEVNKCVDNTYAYKKFDHVEICNYRKHKLYSF